MRDESSFVYILTNKYNKVLYVGVTSNLKRRMYEHRKKLVDGFSKKYNLTKLVFAEGCSNIVTAIQREKQIKGWLRTKKISLIQAHNPSWIDLYDSI
jgi:putative endonuclease